MHTIEQLPGIDTGNPLETDQHVQTYVILRKSQRHRNHFNELTHTRITQAPIHLHRALSLHHPQQAGPGPYLGM